MRDGSLLAGLAVLVVLRLVYSRVRSVRLHRVASSHGGESLIVSARVAGIGRTLFLLDTAYAGAPVLSLSYLARPDPHRGGSVQERFSAAQRRLASPVGEDEMRSHLHRFSAASGCRSFTSGCRMRLMGIGETVERQADLFVCPSLSLDGMGLPLFPSDVMVTHPLPGCVHILTTDYLMHRSPVLLSMRRSRLYFRSLPHPLMRFLPAESVGGAFCVTVSVSGSPMRCVLDTGAAVTLAVGKEAAERISRCQLPDAGQGSLVQVGVNGEEVCSDVVVADVQVGGLSFPRVSIVLNTREVEGADAYMGMGLMRALDWWFSAGRIGMRPSGLSPRFAFDTRPSSCGTKVPSCLPAKDKRRI